MIIAWLNAACQKRHGRLASAPPCAPSATERTMDFATSVAELHGLLLNRTVAISCLEEYYQDKVNAGATTEQSSRGGFFDIAPEADNALLIHRVQPEAAFWAYEALISFN